MTALSNIYIVLFFVFIAAIFFIITHSELKRGETLIKTCFAAGLYCIIFAGLHIMLECKIIDISLLIILVVIEFAVYIVITLYSFKYVKSTVVYGLE